MARVCAMHVRSARVRACGERGEREVNNEKERERESKTGEKRKKEMRRLCFESARGIFSATYKSPLCTATSVVAHVHACALVYGARYK